MNMEVIEALKNAALTRRLKREAEIRERSAIVRRRAEAEWVAMLTQVYRDWPALCGLIDETCPDKWQPFDANLVIVLPNHVPIALSYTKTSVSWVARQSMGGVFAVDHYYEPVPAHRDYCCVSSSVGCSDLGDALLYAEDGYRRREEAAAEGKKQANANDLLAKVEELKPTLEEMVTASLAEFIRHTVEDTKYAPGCDPEEPTS